MAFESSASLFEAPLGSPLGDAVAWLNQLMFGTLAVTLCVIAVATVGFLMLSGRLPVRQGLRVVVGCFILLGAPIIASTFTSAISAPSRATGSPFEPPTSSDLETYKK
jgi:type IV secretory pathway VirB2 component (pilin)